MALDPATGPFIRRATHDDLPTLVEVARRSFFDAYGAIDDPADVRAYAERHFTISAFAGLVDDPSSLLALLFDRGPDGELVGYALLVPSATPSCVACVRAVELSRLYLLADAIGRGHGAALLRHAFAWAAQQGHATMWLGVYDRNERAMAFYRRLGFEVVGTRPFDWHGVIYHDPVMARAVAAPGADARR